jgi:plastocyanin
MTDNRFSHWLSPFSARRVRASLLTVVLTVVLVSLVACGGMQPATQAPSGGAAAGPSSPATVQPASVPATSVAATASATTVADATVAHATVAALATVETPKVTAVATVSRVLTAVAPTTVVPTAPAFGVVSGEGEVDLEDFSFRPQVLTVRVGTVVKFSNKDRAVHTVTSDTGLFDSGSLNKGDDYFYTFTQVGEYPYYCAPHGGPGGQGMSGKIVVVP